MERFDILGHRTAVAPAEVADMPAVVDKVVEEVIGILGVVLVAVPVEEGIV